MCIYMYICVCVNMFYTYVCMFLRQASCSSVILSDLSDQHCGCFLVILSQPQSGRNPTKGKIDWDQYVQWEWMAVTVCAKNDPGQCPLWLPCRPHRSALIFVHMILMLILFDLSSFLGFSFCVIPLLPLMWRRPLLSFLGCFFFCYRGSLPKYLFRKIWLIMQAGLAWLECCYDDPPPGQVEMDWLLWAYRLTTTLG